MSVAIYYHPEAYSTSGPKLMGRNAAGESFLKGYFLNSDDDSFWVHTSNKLSAERFAKLANSFNRSEIVQFINFENISALSKPGILYYPGPDICSQALNRSFYGNNLWSLCGITHTTSSLGAIDSISSLVTSPIFKWDALICTSEAVKINVENVIGSTIKYYEKRFDGKKFVLPQLPVIPLGINVDEFSFSKEDKLKARKYFHIDEDTIIVLYMGRLSFHAKAHPLAMYQALESAYKKTKKNILLVECGWFANDQIKLSFKEAASSAAPNIQVRFIDGRDLKNRQFAWAAADIFCSLSDNIQETFGITPIEAMASGLPVVVSDWNGYRDSVRHNVDGFRVKTTIPGNGLGMDFIRRHSMQVDNYDMYVGLTSSLISVDIEEATAFFIKLINSKELRVKMGQEGKKRAYKNYDWSVVIKQYQHLWNQLDLIRIKEANEFNNKMESTISRLDPFQAFSQYSSNILCDESVISLVETNILASLEKIESYLKLSMVNYSKYIIPNKEIIHSLLTTISSDSKNVLEIVSSYDIKKVADIKRSLCWLLKLGIIRIKS
tara:strand:- start:1814 stop:3466 length:1653 start_codon:yes stop_codon:yes gene_type:complete